MDAMTDATLPSDSMLQHVVAGRFRIIEQLGEGTVGDIYLAEHRVLGRKYALKVLKRRFLSNHTVAERFRREALVASRLEHPNIVEISDFGRAENGRLFLAMEYIRGESLGAAIAEHLPGVMPLRRGLKILAQVASAVAAAHDAGVLHRDLKPDNIMLTLVRNAELVKILDFGLAKVMVDAESLVLTKRGEMFGTPMYMSPEQARGEEVDSRTDIYAFGAVAYEPRTGRSGPCASARWARSSGSAWRGTTPGRAHTSTPSSTARWTWSSCWRPRRTARPRSSPHATSHPWTPSSMPASWRSTRGTGGRCAIPW
jgi:serine/threonine-protein kinase